jgi:flagellar motility protein MotE (MotC chaperone)
VKVYEAMKPRDAATIFNDLGMPVLLAVVDRMKETKAAAILAAMTPEKARDVTMQLAQVRTKPAAAADAGGKSPANPESGKASRAGT